MAKTAQTTFEGVLAELELKVEQLGDDLASQDAQAFLRHSEFLNQKFGPQGHRMTTTTTTTPPTFTLTPPEVITPVQPVAAVEAVPLKTEVADQVDEQVRRFIDALEKEDLHSEPFKAKLDSAFQLGRQEISVAAGLMQGSLMQRNFVGATDTPAYKAIAAIRGQLDELNPGKEGDLPAAAQAARAHPVRQQAGGLFPQVRVGQLAAADGHDPALRGQGRHPEGRHRHRGHARQAVGRDAGAGCCGPLRAHAGHAAGPSVCSSSRPATP